MRRRLFGSLTSALVSAHRRVTAHDACDGPSFNLAIGPVVCERNGAVTFDALIGQLGDGGSAGLAVRAGCDDAGKW